MYGSIHNHFESLNDTGNELSVMLDEFESVGAKKVAVTEHGVFASFEDLKDLCKNRDLKVVPGVEGYFTDQIGDMSVNRAHIILLAKDQEGYRSLSRLITKSNQNFQGGYPILNWEILKELVAKGHIVCTTACIQGIFGQLLESATERNERRIDEYISDLGFDINQIKEIQDTEAILGQQRKDAKKNKETFPKELEEQYQANHKYFQHIKRKLPKIDALRNENTEVSEAAKAQACDIAWQQLVDIFGKENVYFEVQNHGLPQERDIYPKIVELAKKYQHEDHLVASNDTHVGKVTPTEEDFIRRNLAQFNRFKKVSEISEEDRQLYIKDDDALKQSLLQILPEQDVDIAIANIEGVLQQCETDYLYAKAQNHYPKFCEDEDKELERLVQVGVREKFPQGFPTEEYQKRVNHELKIIESMGYSGYFLIVQDYLEYARLLGYLPPELIAKAPLTIPELQKFITDHKIPMIGINVGFGRGSGVGSLCCYLLGISDVDPIQYNLLFERFLNPERKSMPDIDSDFRTDIREKAVEYCANKYGATRVCQVITKSFGKIQGNLRLASRYLGTREYQKLPIKQRLTTPLKDFLQPWYQVGDKLSKLYENNNKEFSDQMVAQLSDREKEVFRYATLAQGLFTQYGQHAAATIISKDDIADFMPLYYNSKKSNFSTQCNMAQAEGKGFLKMDFLCLDNLNILTEMMRLTGDTGPMDYFRRPILLEDKSIYQKIFDTGLTHGVFQFESDGMKKMLKDFQPESFEDIILLVAAYRPGPMQYLDEIIRTKHYLKNPEAANAKYQKDLQEYQQKKQQYDADKAQAQQEGRQFNQKEPVVPKAPTHRSIDINNPTLERILKPTYGCIIYQEQVMSIFRELAGFSMGRADLVRRAMSKKHLDELEKEREAFIYGNQTEVDAAKEKQAQERANGIPEDQLTPIPAEILGCVKKEGISVEDAEKLYDQMLDFASYAFNKSHATAYAMTAFMTAYYKNYYPGVFYEVALKHVKEHEEIAGFAKEMPSLGLHLAPPTPDHSQPDFWYDGKDTVHFGYSRIKGIGLDAPILQKKYESIDEFAHDNPNVSVSAMLKMAETGMFNSMTNNNPQLAYEYVARSIPAQKKIDAVLQSCKEKNYDTIKTSQAVNKCTPPVPMSQYQVKADGVATIKQQYSNLGFVFPPVDIQEKLQNSAGFMQETTGSDRAKPQWTGVLVLSCNETVFKNGEHAFAVTVMDKSYQTRRYFSAVPITKPYGLLPLNTSPFCLKNNRNLVMRDFDADTCFNIPTTYERKVASEIVQNVLKSNPDNLPKEIGVSYNNSDLGFKISSVQKELINKQLQYYQANEERER